MEASPAPPADVLAGSPWSRLDFCVAAAVVAVTMLLTWVFRTEIVSTDPWHYGMAAVDFPQDSWVPLGYTRYGMILPLGPLVIAFGHAAVTFYAPAILASGVLAGSLYLLGRRWWGHIAGLTAVALLLTNWIVFFNLSRFYPDIPSISLVMLALVLAVAARGRQRSGARFADTLPVMVGFLLGWSFEARETALFAWPAVIVVLWVHGRVVRNAVLTALPVLLWAAVDVVISAVAYGDPLLKLHTFTRQDLSITKLPADMAVMDQFIDLPRTDYLTMIPRFAIESGVPGGVWFVVLGALAMLAVFVRNAAVRLSAAALITSYVLFVGVSGFFLPEPPRRPTRRAALLDPVRALDSPRDRRGRSTWWSGAVLRRAGARQRQVAHAVLATLLVVAPTVTLVSAVSASPNVSPNGGTPMAGISAEISRLGLPKDASIFTDYHSLRVLPIYQRPALGGDKQWQARVRSITGKRQPATGDYRPAGIGKVEPLRLLHTSAGVVARTESRGSRKLGAGLRVTERRLRAVRSPLTELAHDATAQPRGPSPADTLTLTTAIAMLTDVEASVGRTQATPKVKAPRIQTAALARWRRSATAAGCSTRVNR